MRRFDFIILMICCLAWAGNFTISAWAVGREGAPPFLLAAVRAALVLPIMGIFLFRPRPEQFARLIAVCLCVGPIHLGFLYTGLQTAPASGSAIVSQMLIPFATILSVIFLKERIGQVRILAIIGASLGVVIMLYDPAKFGFDIGLIYIILAYLSLAVGSVLMKSVGAVDWRIYVAWMAATVLPAMALCSLLFESQQAVFWQTNKWPLVIAAAYGAVVVTIFAHGRYFDMVQRYPISIVVPLTLMVPVFASALGVVFLQETLYVRYLVGAALILPCVYVIAKRQSAATLNEDK